MSIEFIRGELERLFTLEEMQGLSTELLGLDPASVGGGASSASYARALTERCRDRDALGALVDAVTSTKSDASPKLARVVAELLGGPVELKVGEEFGPYRVVRRVGAGPHATVYAVTEGEEARFVRVLHGAAASHRGAVQRYLTRVRLAARVVHDTLPRKLAAGFVGSVPYVAYEAPDAQPLSKRIGRTGALHLNEARVLLGGVLGALGALHERGLPHGAVKLDNVLVTKAADGTPRALLVDVGSDLLFRTDVVAEAPGGLRGLAPEQLKGQPATPRSDLYAFGELLFEVLSGKPPFGEAAGADLAVALLSKAPPELAEVAPRGWVSRELGDLCARLLDKEPSRRPSVASVAELVAPSTKEKRKETITEEEVNERIDALVADPTDVEAAIALELTLEQGAAPITIAEAFLMAADQVDIEAAGSAAAEKAEGAVGEAMEEAAQDRARDQKKALLFRAARLFESVLKDSARCEEIFKWLLDIDATDEVARAGFETALRAQEKYDELVEVLLEQSEKSESHSERAGALHKIGRLYAGPLEDPEQAVYAFAQALAQDIQNETYATDLERAAGTNMTYWAEAMRTLHQVSEHPRMPPEVKVSLFTRLGAWYNEKVARPDLALPCFEAVLKVDPANEGALEGLAQLYRRAQQWAELVVVLLMRVDRAATPDRARDFRAEAADILETRLSDAGRARELYEQTLREDPGHQKTVDALARIYQRDNDYAGYAKILARQAEALSGGPRSEILCRIGDIYEDQLNDLVEAEKHYKAALALDPGMLTALRAVDRILNRKGRYDELLENLRAQIAVAATPRQKINLHERMAGIYDEEFLDHQKAAECLEQVLTLDAAHEGALTALMRHYRALDRWEDLILLYERALKITTTDTRRVELLMALGRTLLDQVGSPERARHAYEKVLEIDPKHAGALESLANVRAQTGDALAALSAVESLAEKAETPEARGEQWLRAAKILEDHGDRDGAIERYRRALDAQPSNQTASHALRAAYLARGDAASAVDIIEREIGQTDGKLAQARLHCDIAELQRTKLGLAKEARESAQRAVDLDPTNLRGYVILGDLAFEAGSFAEASTHYGQVVPRAESLPKDDAKQVLIHFIDSLAKIGSTEKAQNTVQALLTLAPDDPDALARAARVRLDSDDATGSANLYRDLLDRFGESLSPTRKLEALLHYGRALRKAGDAEAALVPLSEAADLATLSVEPINELAAAYGELEQWEEVMRVKRRRLDIAEGEERSQLLLDIGEVLATKLKDPMRAAKSLVAALEERPDDRKILTRLMKLYSEEKDWSKLVDVVVKLAEGVEDKLQKAKYIHTAAVVSARQIGNPDQAAAFFEQVLTLDPSNDKALTEAIDVAEQRGDDEAYLRLLGVELERAKAKNEPARLKVVHDRLGRLYLDKLGKVTEGIAALEAAQKLDPEDAARADKLADLYADNLEAYLDKAIEAQMQVIRKNPFNATPYRKLRKLYTEARQADSAWCLCQALHCLNFAEPDEERFFRRMRAESAAEAQQRLTDDEWARVLMHPSVDPLVTAIFTLIEPAVMARNAQPLEALGFQNAYALDLSMHPYPMSQTLYYAGGVLGMDLPLTFQNPHDPGGISFLHARPPAIVLGSTALAVELPIQAAAFIAARHLVYYRPGLYIRHLVPTGTGLRAWLFAAIRLIHEGFPIAAEFDKTVTENQQAIDPVIQGPARDQLASAVTKLLQSGAIDLKKWVAGVDLTADRAGFLVAHDLEVACEMIKASDEASAAVPQRDRLRELTMFSIERGYFELRKRLAISVDS
ncbi:MAG: tetratricopeptide repeat protein [Polyangiaceae bacterium]|nr:tetratricopeptide repeat protein [Polyangiaceae bacterium]